MDQQESAKNRHSQPKSSFWKKALLINSVAILIIVFSIGIFFTTPWGNPVYKTILLVTEVTPDFPVKPIRILTKSPVVEETKIQTQKGEILADLYRPRDAKKHPAIVFTLGTIVTRKNPQVTQIAQALARSNFVVLVPDLPDFLLGFVWTDSVETLISSVEFLDQQSFVNKKKIGFAGFCVGASAAIIAAENERISDKVAFISAISPYFNLRVTSEIVVTKQAEDENGIVKPWEPANLSVETVKKGFINYVANEDERQLLRAHFLDDKTIPTDKLENFSVEAKSIYDFLTNSDRQNLDNVWINLPEEFRNLAVTLSPSTKIEQLNSKLFILNDKKDTFVPRIEGVKLAKSLPKQQVRFVEVDSFEHVNPATRLERLAAVRQLFHLGLFVYNVLVEVS